MSSLSGPPAPDNSTIESAIAAITGSSAPLDEVVPDWVTVALDVTGWGLGEIAELLAPLADQRIPVADATSYLDRVSLLHRLAKHLDGDALTPEPELAGLRETLGDQLRQDCTTPAVWDAWAVAAWAEDDAERPTISARTLRWLTEIEHAAGKATTADASIAHHAGALHTYGYLCSSLWTKYGWKRTRWVGGGVAAAAGVHSALLQPVPPSGTLLANATTLAARLLGWSTATSSAFTEDVRPTARLLGRVVEVATAEQTREGDKAELDEPIEMRSSLFRRDDAPPNGAPNLLVYSVIQAGSERLVTMFDVGDEKVAYLLDPPASEPGDPVPIRLRYNALLDGAGTEFTGSCRVERASGRHLRSGY